MIAVELPRSGESQLFRIRERGWKVTGQQVMRTLARAIAGASSRIYLWLRNNIKITYEQLKLMFHILS